MKALACFGGKAGTIEVEYRYEITSFEKFYRARRLGASVPHPLRQRILCRRSAGFFAGTAVGSIRVG